MFSLRPSAHWLMQTTVLFCLPAIKTQSRRCNPILFCHCGPGIPHRNQFWGDSNLCLLRNVTTLPSLTPAKPTAVPDGETPIAGVFAEPGQADSNWEIVASTGSPKVISISSADTNPRRIISIPNALPNPSAQPNANPPNMIIRIFGFSGHEGKLGRIDDAHLCSLAFFVQVSCHSDS